jgi:hypothetical protein
MMNNLTKIAAAASLLLSLAAVNEAYAIPIANAGPDLNAYTGDFVSLLGSASEPDGYPIIIWSWNLVDVPLGGVSYLDNADQPTAMFHPLTAGNFGLTLQVVDAVYNQSIPDTVYVHVAD